MGSSYVNYTFGASDSKAVEKLLSGRHAFVSRAMNGRVVVLDEELSKHLGCPVAVPTT
jgi:hypothetical protein